MMELPPNYRMISDKKTITSIGEERKWIDIVQFVEKF